MKGDDKLIVWHENKEAIGWFVAGIGLILFGFVYPIGVGLFVFLGLVCLFFSWLAIKEKGED